MKRSHFKIAFYLFVVFASGIVVGAFGHLYTVKASKLEATRPRNPEEWRAQYVKDMTTRLKLDGEQLRNLNGILDATRDRYKAVKERYRPEMKAIHDQQIASVRSMLNSSQQLEYDRYRAERQKKLEQEKR